MGTTKTVIALDGPAASGKTTIGKQLADALGYIFLDTGCMYRAATLAVLQQGIDVYDETAVTDLVRTIDMAVKPGNGHNDGRAYTVLLNDEDVTWAIRKPEVDANVSQVSKYAGVRHELVQRQRAMAARGSIVMVGRDIGTVVLPDAPLKLYMTATAAERAQRRWQDRRAQGYDADFDAILADVERRDRIDSNRQHSPLRPAGDALLIDTTGYSIADVFAQVLKLVQDRLPQVEPGAISNES